jgi:hypothetical protein
MGVFHMLDNIILIFENLTMRKEERLGLHLYSVEGNATCFRQWSSSFVSSLGIPLSSPLLAKQRVLQDICLPVSNKCASIDSD